MPPGYRVVILTTRHSITGDLLLLDQRLSDYLNDRRETVISLRDTLVARIHEPGKILQQHLAAMVPKAHVVAAFEPPQSGIPAAKRLYGYVRKQQHQVFLILDGMEIQGTLHTLGDLDLRRVISGTGEGFLPITNATLVLNTNERFIIQQDAIMVHESKILYIGKILPKRENAPSEKPQADSA